MMKLQDVLLKAMAKKITWWEAAEIIGVTDRTMRRWRGRLEADGYSGLADRRKGRASEKRVPLATVEEVLRLFREIYFDLNMRHFHEKLRAEHGIELSYTWVQKALQGAGLVVRHKKRGKHRRRRERRALPGMLLHIDGSKHRWLNDDRWYDLIVILDDATSEIYYAQLVEEESTRTVMAGLWEVILQQGLFCALYSDRGSHFFVTPKAGERVDKHRLTQVGRAMKELGVQMIPAYSPQARGRGERNFGTWQGRLPQELRLAGITELEEANRFLRERYIAVFNEKFQVAAREKGTAFQRTARSDLDWIFTVQTERVVNKDNTVAIADRMWQLEKSQFRSSLAGCTVTIHEHLNGTLDSLWTACGGPLHGRRESPRRRAESQDKPWKRRACGSGGKPQTGFPPLPPSLGNPAKPAGFPLSHRFDGHCIYSTENTQTPLRPAEGERQDKSVETGQITCE
jgi:transposase